MSMTDPDGNLILAIFYDDNGNPYTVFSGTARYAQEWNFETCDDGNVVYRNTGSGLGGGYWNPQRPPYNRPMWPVWLRPGVKLRTAACRDKRTTNCGRRLARGGLKLLRSPIQLCGFISTHNPFEAANEGDAEYCKVCEVFHNVTDTSCPCDHLEWCDECGLWTGQGADDECGCGINDQAALTGPPSGPNSKKDVVAG